MQAFQELDKTLEVLSNIYFYFHLASFRTSLVSFWKILFNEAW